jgi:Camelysin metallo-endopeptidase
MAEPSHSGFLGSNRSRLIAALAAVAGLLLAAIIILLVSRTTFTAQTQTGTSSFSTGNVSLTNDHEDSAVFTATNLRPGDTGTQVVRVDYTGSLESEIRMYAQAGNQALDQHITVNTGTVEGTYGAPTWTGTLAGLKALDYSTGALPWSVTGPASRFYEFTYTLNAGTPDAMQDQTTEAVFTWEAR